MRPESLLWLQGLQWAALRCFSSTGEASAPDDYHWLMAMAGYKPVIEMCGGTEIGGGFIAGSMLQSQSPSTFSMPSLGKPQPIETFYRLIEPGMCLLSAHESERDQAGLQTVRALQPEGSRMAVVQSLQPAHAYSGCAGSMRSPVC